MTPIDQRLIEAALAAVDTILVDDAGIRVDEEAILRLVKAVEVYRALTRQRVN